MSLNGSYNDDNRRDNEREGRNNNSNDDDGGDDGRHNIEESQQFLAVLALLKQTPWATVAAGALEQEMKEKVGP